MGNKTIYFKDDELWDRAKQLAGKETISAVIQVALARFVDEKRREAEGFTHHRLETGFRDRLETDFRDFDGGGRWGTTERVAFEGRQIATYELPYIEPTQNALIPQMFTVYLTKAGKLVLAVGGGAEENGISHYGVYSSIRELADDPELERADPFERAEFLDAISKQLGQDWAVWID